MSRPCPLFGFIVTLTPHASTIESDVDAMHGDLITTLEVNGLLATSGSRRAPSYRVTREGAQATDADRHLLLAWADRWAHVATIGVSALTDLGDDA